MVEFMKKKINVSFFSSSNSKSLPKVTVGNLMLLAAMEMTGAAFCPFLIRSYEFLHFVAYSYKFTLTAGYPETLENTKFALLNSLG